MAKQPFTFESNLEKVIGKIEEKPYKVMNTIGQTLVKEIRPTVPKQSGQLKKSLGYWARKRERDLQIGFKVFYAPFVFRTRADVIRPVVLKNAELIKDMINKALDEIRKE